MDQLNTDFLEQGSALVSTCDFSFTWEIIQLLTPLNGTLLCPVAG